MSKPKPCPFCSGKPNFDYSPDCDFFPGCWSFSHICTPGTKPGRAKRIHIFAAGFDTKDEATDAWNHRIEENQQLEVDAFVAAYCKNCTHECDKENGSYCKTVADVVRGITKRKGKQ